MGVALVLPDAKHGGDRRSSLANKLDPKELGFSKSLLSQARFVLRHCRDKAEEVLRNAKYPLTVAYEEAQAIVEQQRLAEEERQRQLAALATITRPEYPRPPESAARRGGDSGAAGSGFRPHGLCPFRQCPSPPHH